MDSEMYRTPVVDVQPFPLSLQRNASIHHGKSSKSARKMRAQTMKACDWEAHKDFILELHIKKKQPLRRVRDILERERGVQAGIRQYRFRISQWGFDKNIKKKEYQAIVRKRQYRKLREPSKRDLSFQVRGVEVPPSKIDSWMRDQGISKHELYNFESAAISSPDIDCRTISERGSPAPSSSEIFQRSSDLDHHDVNIDGVYAPSTARRSLSPQKASERSESTIKTPQAVDLSWSLHTSWKELLAGHSRDEKGYPLRALVTGLLKEPQNRDFDIPAFTLSELLLELCPVEKGGDKFSIGFETDAIGRETRWSLFVLATPLDDSLGTLLVSVCLESADNLEGLHCRLETRLRWVREKYDRTNGFVSFRVLRKPDDDAFLKAVRHNDIVAAQRTLKSRETAVFHRDWLGNRPIAMSAELGNIEMTQFLLGLDSNVNNATRYHHSILWPIWEGFVIRCNASDNISFEDNFHRCKALTSLALRHGAQIDECVFYDGLHSTLLHMMLRCKNLKLQQWRELLQYLIQLGIDIEKQNYSGRTPLLYAIDDCRNDGSEISALTGLGADVSASDYSGKGYMDLLLDQLEDIDSEAGISPLGMGWVQRLISRLTVLMTADRNCIPTIASTKSPVRNIAYNEKAWRVWTQIMERLGWSMEDSNAVRFEQLLKPDPRHRCSETERESMLEQAASCLTPAQIVSLSQKQRLRDTQEV